MDGLIEKIKSIVEMYKKEQISEYVLERELAECMGDKSHVMISKDNKNIVTKTFGLFMFPQLLSDGFHTTYIVDNHALKEFYTAEEFAVVASRIKAKHQKYLAKYNTFHKETFNGVVTPGIALGFFLDLYSGYLHELRINETSDNFLPEADEVRKYADAFNLGDNEITDVESLIIKGYVCEEVVEFAKKYAHEGKDEGLSFSIVDGTEAELPQLNLGNQEIMKLCTSTFGIRDHKEIPHDYQPPR